MVDTRLVDTAFSGDEQGMQRARQSIDNAWLMPACQRITSSKGGKIKLMNEDGDCALFNESLIVNAAGVGGFLNFVLKVIKLPQSLWHRLAGSTKA